MSCGCPDPIDCCKEESVTSCPEVTFCTGNYSVQYKAGCLTKTKKSDPVPDGWYTKVRIVDGCIVEATQAPAPVTQLASPCGTGSGTGTSDVCLDTAACNLSTLVNGCVRTEVNYIDSEYLTFTGCGTAGNPFVPMLNYTLLKQDLLDGGTNFNECGYVITNGIVKNFPKPVLSIKSAFPSVLSVSQTGCEVTLTPAVTSATYLYSRPFTCPTANGGTDCQISALGYVRQGPGTTATVQICRVLAGVLLPAVPVSFATVQEAVTWLDTAQVTNCPPVI